MGARALGSGSDKRLLWSQGTAEFEGVVVDPVAEIRGLRSAPPLGSCVTLGKPRTLSVSLSVQRRLL